MSSSHFGPILKLKKGLVEVTESEHRCVNDHVRGYISDV